MAIKTINVGVKPNDGTGDPNRDAFIKANENFHELFASAQGAATERDSINAAVAATNATVSTLADSVQGAAAGNVSAATWSALTAIVGTRAGQPAAVADTDTGTHADPVVGVTVSNAGEYAWSTSPAGWRWVSNAASLVKTAVSPISMYFGDSPVIYDYYGVYGQIRTLYFKRSFFARTLKGATTLTIGTDSVRIPGYTEVQTAGTTTLYSVFINRLSGEISVYAQNALPAINDALLQLFNVRGAVISNEIFPVLSVESGIGNVYAFDPFVIEENRRICIPRIVYNSRLYSSTRPTPTGFFEKELDGFAPSATGQVLYFDQVAAAKGEDPFKVASNPFWPESPLCFPLISSGGASAPYANPRGIPLIGAVPGGSVPNVSNLGRNSLDRTTLRFGSTAQTDTLSAGLIARGTTKGFNDPSGNSPIYGAPLSDLKPGEIRPVRIAVETDVDNDFPFDVRAFLVDGTGTGRVGTTMKMERQIDARSAIYFCWYQVPTTASYFPAKGIWAGVLNAPAGRKPIVAEFAVGAGSKSRLWLMRGDYPDPVDNSGGDPTTNPAVKQAILLAGDKSDGKLLYPNEMFLIEGREQKLYGDQLFETRTDGQDVFMTLETRTMMPGNEWPLPVSGKRELTVKGGTVAATTALITRTISQASKDSRTLREISVRTAGLTALAGTSTTALFIGDSLTEYTGFPQAAGRELSKVGMTLNYTGTVDIRELDGATGGQNIVKGEGRGSRDIRNYTYQDGTGAAVPCDPFPDSFIATYLAMSTTDKKAYNPFLRPATGSDPSDCVFNGYIFDMRFYLTRFGLADPAIVVFNLGTNDINHGGLPAQSAAVATGIKVLIAQTLLALPNAYVGLVVNPLPRIVSGDSKWSQQVMLYKILQAAALARTEVDGAGRPRVSLIPAYAHCTPDVGYTETIGDTDAATGVKTMSMTDPLHYRGTVKEQVGRAVAAWIACRKVGA